jgi:hypothetical protein
LRVKDSHRSFVTKATPYARRLASRFRVGKWSVHSLRRGEAMNGEAWKPEVPSSSDFWGSGRYRPSGSAVADALKVGLLGKCNYLIRYKLVSQTHSSERHPSNPWASLNSGKQSV